MDYKSKLEEHLKNLEKAFEGCLEKYLFDSASQISIRIEAIITLLICNYDRD